MSFGSQGVQGALGAQGNQGHQGVQGAPGAGNQGVQGNQGHQGVQGAAGTGNQGVQGALGAQGNQGHQGVQGTAGAQGAQGAVGAQGAQGNQGHQGVQGADGNFGGATFYYTFEANTNDAQPGAGDLRLDNSTQNAATGIYIDDTDADGSNIADFLQTIDDSTSTIKGHVKISNKLDAGQFILFTISSLTDNTGYFDITVSPVDSSATNPFSADEDIIVTFARTGDRGDAGAQGNQGHQGVQGADGNGVQGFQGVQGAAGQQGNQGVQGAVGAQGAQGAAGQQGNQGHQGVQGAAGAQGAQGAVGAQGDDGVQGHQGHQGVQGAVGAQGAQGAAGQQGNQGHQGRQGATGTGSPGNQGNQGHQGHQGLAGAQGAQGAVGAQGAQGSSGTGSPGAQGNQGHQGVQGALGAQGNQGRQGATGPQGVQGAGGLTTTNADTVDNLHASSFLRSDTSDTMTGSLTVNCGNTNTGILAQANGGVGNSGRIMMGFSGTNNPLLRLDDVNNDMFWGIGAHDNDNNLYIFGAASSGSFPTFSGAGSGISASYQFMFDTSGNFSANANVTAFSDIRLKTNIKVISNALDKVSKIRGVTFDRIDNDLKQTGVIAQEVEKVLPEAVITDSKNMKSVAYGNMSGLLIEAIKELRDEVTSKLNTIEDRLDLLEHKINQ